MDYVARLVGLFAGDLAALVGLASLDAENPVVPVNKLRPCTCSATDSAA